MASDRTSTKRHGWVTEHVNPRALAPCPSCHHLMAMDAAHAMLAVDEGRLASNRELRWAEASHTVPESLGGRDVALECNRCNRDRRDAGWTTSQPTYRVWRRKGATITTARRSVGELTALGYPTE